MCDIFCTMTHKYKSAAAIVLGMHDALVSLTGMIAGLTFTFTDRTLIILSAIIASVAAALSMGASNYLAEKTGGGTNPIKTGIITCVAYMATCVVLILPFIFISNTRVALIISGVIVVLVILGCNWRIGHRNHQPWWKHAIEMLVICASVSVISFIIGEVAKSWLGVMI